MSDATDDLDDMPYRITNKPKKISEPLYRKKTELQPVCPNCLSDIEVKNPAKMYRDCNCGEWRNDILLGWEYIPSNTQAQRPPQ